MKLARQRAASFLADLPCYRLWRDTVGVKLSWFGVILCSPFIPPKRILMGDHRKGETGCQFISSKLFLKNATKCKELQGAIA